MYIHIPVDATEIMIAPLSNTLSVTRFVIWIINANSKHANDDKVTTNNLHISVFFHFCNRMQCPNDYLRDDENRKTHLFKK
jgi:hypothetical protein